MCSVHDSHRLLQRCACQLAGQCTCSTAAGASCDSPFCSCHDWTSRPHHDYTHLVALVTSPSMNHLQTVHHDAFSISWSASIVYIWHCYPSHTSTRLCPPTFGEKRRLQLQCPRVLSKFGRHSFSVSGRDAWNSLPRQLRGIAVASTFKHHLKSELFFQAYAFWRLLQPLLNPKIDCITDWRILLTICVLSSFLTLF